MVMSNHFPQEHFLRLGHLDPYFKGRIIIYQGPGGYDLEIDIVQSETGKIYNHVKSMYNQDDPREALDSAVQCLRDYLHSKKS